MKRMKTNPLVDGFIGVAEWDKSRHLFRIPYKGDILNKLFLISLKTTETNSIIYSHITFLTNGYSSVSPIFKILDNQENLIDGILDFAYNKESNVFSLAISDTSGSVELDLTNYTLEIYILN